MLELASVSDWEAVERLARQNHELHVQWRPDIYTMPEKLYTEDRFDREVRERSLYVAKIGGEGRLDEVHHTHVTTLYRLLGQASIVVKATINRS